MLSANLTVGLMALGMAALSFMMGYLPKVFKNEALLQLLSVFGGGNLLGVTFLILFPESISAIVEATTANNQVYNQNRTTSLVIGLCIAIGYSVMVLIDELVARLFKKTEEHQSTYQNIAQGD